MRFTSFIVACSLAQVSAHMGISTPVPLDRAVGDAYRNPVSSDNNPTEGGACHGQTAGAKYAWVWTPRDSGTCEIYQNCFKTLPTTLTMSGGAPHNGGPCAMYECTGAVTLPSCVRMSLPKQFGSCRQIWYMDGCTTAGSMTAGGAAPPGTTPSPTAALPPASGPAQTPLPSSGLIRCGKNWNDANSKCGAKCTLDSQCGAGEACYADLAPCSGSGGTPKPPATSPPLSNPGQCKSKQAHISDAFCRAVQCAPVYNEYCGFGAISAAKEVNPDCINHAVTEGQDWATVALKYDTTVEELKKQNPEVQDAVLSMGTVLQLNCKSAPGSSDASAVGPSLLAVAGVMAAVRL